MPREVEVELGENTFKAELADTPLARAKGLSFRSEGKMLFRFPRPGRPAIDMMFLSVPLQLVFLDQEKRVVDVQRAEPWSLDPRTWKVYRPGEKSKYLLESSEFLDVEVGDRLEFEI